jgi:hypothetical protein
MLLSRHQNKEKTWAIKIPNKYFENVAQFKYLGTTVTNQNFNREEIKKKLNSSYACYHSVNNLLSSRLLCGRPAKVDYRLLEEGVSQLLVSCATNCRMLHHATSA